MYGSNIEICQNRRLYTDDNKGVIEPLNETDSAGFGMQVNSKYWLNVFDLNTEESIQREHQLRVDQPLQYFFAFNYSQSQQFNSIQSK